MTQARGYQATATALVVAFMLVYAPLPLPAFGQAPNVEDIVRQLKPAEGPQRGRSQGLRMRGVAVEQDTTQSAPEERSIDLTVNFLVNSSRLTTDALIVLEVLGRALNAPELKDLRFQIGGHTDASGNPETNLRLSRARAESVKEYLSREHGISPERLVAQGFGDQRPKDAENPRNPLNRRVQITSQGPSS